MLTPEIKTNLILKEIGIKRYSLRPKKTDISKKTYNSFQKGAILAILDKPFDNFIKEQQDLLKAVLASTKLDEDKECTEGLTFTSTDELKKKLSNFNEIKLIIIFGRICLNLNFDCLVINSPSLSELALKKDAKAKLWTEIKNKLNL